jgi:gliding-associated putative ABC transporter substrate-binding component GldG
MKLRKGVKKGLGSLTSVPLVFGIVVVLNLLALAFFVRFDLTDARLYSLSDASKRIAQSLDDPVLVKLYFSEDLPAPYNQHARYLKDQLYEYRAFSGGKLRFEFIDPIKEDREKEAQALRIPPMQVNAYEKDKIELKRVYMGLAFLYEDKKEVIPVVQSTNNIEYEISSALQKITAEVIPTVGILQGHGEADVANEMQTGSQTLSKLYRVIPVTLSPGDLVGSEVATLLVIGPKDSISTWDQYAIDQFIMRGGKVGAFYDPVEVDIQVQNASDRQTNWPEFLAHYGVRFKPGLILDARNSRIAVMQQQGFIRFQNIVEYPFLPQVYTFNSENLIGKDLEAVDFPFISALDSTLAGSMGLQFQPICWSSERSGIRTPPYYMSPMQEFTNADFSQPFQILAGAIQGSFQTAFPNGPLPDSGVDLTAIDPPLKQSPPNRLVALGDAEFCGDQQISRNPSNAAMFLNIADWLTQEEGLITIRSREVVSRPLDEISDGKRRGIKYANVFGPPLLIILFGVFRWQSRQRAKRAL